MSLTVQVTGTGVTVSPTATTSVSVASTGIVGPEGAQGTQGVQGTVGAGTQGAQGTNGTQGIQGLTGIGTQGTQGIAGTAASNGAQGIQGIQGTVGIEGPKSGATSGSFGSGSYTDQLGFTSIGEVFQWTETSGSTGRPYYVNNQHVGGGTSGTIIYNNGYSTLFSGLPRSYWTFNGIPSQITLAAIDRNGVNRSSELQAATVMTIATDANNFIKYNVTYATSFGSLFTNGTYTVLQFNIVGVVSQAGTPPALAAYETDPGEVMVYLGTETIGGGGGPSTWELISYITGSQGTQGTQGIQGTVGTGIQGTQGTAGQAANDGAQGTQGVQGLAGTGTQGTQGIAGSAASAFPYTGSAQISGSLTVSGSVLINHTGINALKVTATDGIAVVRHDGAFNDPFGSSLGGRIYPGTSTILVNRNGTLATGGGFLGNGSQETFLFLGYNTSTSVGLGTVENSTVIFVSGGLNQTWVGYGDSTKDSKLWVRDYLNVQGQISASGAITGSDLYINNVGSVSASLASAVSSTTIQNIESISSASYAAITPVSGTLYIIT
jgi:hypothetical protein